MTQAQSRPKQSRRCPTRFVRTLTVLLFYVGMLSSPNSTSIVNAAPLTFEFSGVVQENELGSLFPGQSLFPGKSIGESYSGRFTVDPAATVITAAPDYARYDGSLFDVTIEGTSYNVNNFSVWGSAPGGVEFNFDTGNGSSSFFSLRSTNDLYTSADVPTSFNVSDFDELAQIQHTCSSPLDDTGSIDAISHDATAPLTFNFSGIVGNNQLGTLFPGKSIGESYNGSFTVDPAATVTFTAPDAAVYDGSFFDITIEGTPYDVTNFRVWSSSPPGGGVQISFDVGGETAFIALRSTSALYGNADVPTSFDIADFDSIASTQQHFSCDFSLRDAGSIDAISPAPEPTTAVLAALGLLGITCRRRSWA